MNAQRANGDAAALAAVLCAGSLIAQQVASKAARDALFLSNFAVTSLPYMMMGASLFSIVMVLVTSRAMSAFAPSRLMPGAFMGSATLLLVEWGWSGAAPKPAAVAVYLHVAALGSILVSGFWSAVNECFDPRSAKRQIGRIAVAGTLGGLAGGLLAERVAAHLAVTLILPVLAALHFFCGAMALRLKPPERPLADTGAGATTTAPEGARRQSTRAIFQRVPFLRNLGLLVLAGTIGAALLDYVLKARATAAFVDGAALLRFFAVFYTVVGFSTFLVQTAASHISMERLGLTARVAAHPLAIALGGTGAAVAPGFVSAAIARGAQAILYSSLFRSGYEALFVPVSLHDKRRTKTIIDVGFERAGDGLGGGIVRLMLLLPATRAIYSMLLFAVALACFGFLIARRLQAGYVRELEQRLVSGFYRIDPEEISDPMTRTMMMQSMATLVFQKPPTAATVKTQHAGPEGEGKEAVDPMVQRIVDLRSGDPLRVHVALQSAPIGPELAPHVIPLLAWDQVYPHAARALVNAGDRIAGQLVDALLDKDEEFAIRRRIPMILSHIETPKAIEGLLLGLLDRRFEVRFRSGRALARIHERDPSAPIDRNRVFAIVLRETRVDRGVWVSRRLLDQIDDPTDAAFVDDYLRERTNRSLEHVFTVLSLALDKKPLQIAYRGLHTNDPMLRGTALEYLESTLPPDIRESLWPFLEDKREEPRTTRGRQEILESLMNSHHSIQINLAKLREKFPEADR
ncbi:MAG: hypothetical protein ACE5G2_04600 [Candidatus Krumholzibacteriia bacterium]